MRHIHFFTKTGRVSNKDRSSAGNPVHHEVKCRCGEIKWKTRNDG